MQPLQNSEGMQSTSTMKATNRRINTNKFNINYHAPAGIYRSRNNIEKENEQAGSSLIELINNEAFPSL
jgi:hypothetical protein